MGSWSRRFPLLLRACLHGSGRPHQVREVTHLGGLISNMGRNPFTKISNRSDREKGSTSKGGPVFRKLFRLDRTDPLSFGPKFTKFRLNGLRPWLPHPSCKRGHIRMRDCMNRWVTPPNKAVTSPSWSPPPPWKQAPGPFPSWKNFHNWRVFGLRKPGYNKWRWDCLRGQNQNGGRQLTGEERYKTTFFRRNKPPNKRECIRRDRLSGKWLFLWFEAFVSAEAFYDSLIHMYVLPVYLCGCRLH